MPTVDIDPAASSGPAGRDERRHPVQDLNGSLTLQFAKQRIQEFHAEAARQTLAHAATPDAVATADPETTTRRAFGFALWRSPRVHVAEH